eukprot:TRINITY_DN1113_c0_g1_i1.p2 TRINITY_DN1113_c0_g1~~TRINITY_DN1113_c0_g1_i1.p2  ORF type:complete len:137 (+),score=38.59 TRINITY_DN1113_c0_g1_i1:211-621(+)
MLRRSWVRNRILNERLARALSTKKKKGGGDGNLDQGQLAFMKKVLSPEPNMSRPEPELISRAEVAAKEYSRQLMREHHGKMGAMQKSLKLQQAAIQAIPEHLKQAATQEDKSGFSLTRLLPTWTPPIADFAEKRKA